MSPNLYIIWRSRRDTFVRGNNLHWEKGRATVNPEGRDPTNPTGGWSEGIVCRSPPPSCSVDVFWATTRAFSGLVAKRLQPQNIHSSRAAGFARSRGLSGWFGLNYEGSLTSLESLVSLWSLIHSMFTTKLLRFWRHEGHVMMKELNHNLIEDNELINLHWHSINDLLAV